jgi:hypothetical protein
VFVGRKHWVEHLFNLTLMNHNREPLDECPSLHLKCWQPESVCHFELLIREQGKGQVKSVGSFLLV